MRSRFQDYVQNHQIDFTADGLGRVQAELDYLPTTGYGGILLGVDDLIDRDPRTILVLLMREAIGGFWFTNRKAYQIAHGAFSDYFLTGGRGLSPSAEAKFAPNCEPVEEALRNYRHYFACQKAASSPAQPDNTQVLDWE